MARVFSLSFLFFPPLKHLGSTLPAPQNKKAMGASSTPMAKPIVPPPVKGTWIALHCIRDSPEDLLPTAQAPPSRQRREPSAEPPLARGGCLALPRGTHERPRLYPIVPLYCGIASILPRAFIFVKVPPADFLLYFPVFSQERRAEGRGQVTKCIRTV